MKREESGNTAHIKSRINNILAMENLKGRSTLRENKISVRTKGPTEDSGG
jgi:hypothetical protein